MIIIPAIDIIGGRCVRLEQGKYENVKKYDLDPKKVAEEYQEAGLTHLHLVDLDGAKAGILLDVLSEFAERGINMTRIESRPARTTLGTYIFFFDLDTDKGQEVLRAAEESVRKKSIWLKLWVLI